MPKSKYESHVQPHIDAICAWARNGLTVEQIADNLNVATSTFFDYMNKHPELSEALNSNRDIADMHVENALYKSATGYYYEEDVVTNKGDVVRLQKFAQPNTTAQIFWLKNRKSDAWRDKRETEVSGPGGEPLQVNFLNMPRPNRDESGP